jgi:hypothetical protein
MLTQIDPLFYHIFDHSLVDETTKQYEYFEHKEKNVVVKDLTKHEIATSNVESWIHPHNSFLHIRGKILKSDGRILTDSDIVTITNNGFNLFHRTNIILKIKELKILKM